MKTIALVTGANKGIGLEICRQLAQKHFHVLLGSRDESRGREAASSLARDGAEVEAVIVDLAAPATFEKTRLLIEEKFGRLDVLINNAAIGEPEDFQSTAETVPMDTLRRTFETNFFGLVDLTQRLLPLLRRSEHARIVNQSSLLASLTEHSNPDSVIADVHALAYDASKTAVNAFTVHLAKVLRGSSIKVNSAHPGSVKTDMNPAGDLTVEEGARTAVNLATLSDDGPSGGFFYDGKNLSW
jgi:NAD(P)-dependent dehydrogenase (short-subunit alcohol dehydrogenase family)